MVHLFLAGLRSPSTFVADGSHTRRSSPYFCNPLLMRILPALLLILIPASLYAQDDKAHADADTAGVVLHSDPRVAVLFQKKHESGYHGIRGAIRSQRGYRVQIYNGNDRAIANQRKIDFVRRYPGVRSYMSFISPSFRLKVGDFASRADAVKFLQQISAFYSASMVVPDIVEINTLRNDN